MAPEGRRLASYLRVLTLKRLQENPFLVHVKPLEGEGRLERRLRLYTRPKLLICDEMGYPPLDSVDAANSSRLVSDRQEHGTMIIASNTSYANWGRIFGDPVLAAALLDRLLHHSVTINIRGNSYRMKEKLKAGLVNPFRDEATSV